LIDIIVIGAGVSGCAIARELSRKNASVLVVEREEDVCCGTTKANSAIVHAGYDAKEGTLKALLNVKGCEMMEGITTQLGVSYNKCGSLVIGYTDEDLKHLELLLASTNKKAFLKRRDINEGFTILASG
jgi:glycerol-3-phosphate dehydrogenase